MKTTVTSDPARTAARIAALETYFREAVMRGDRFVCPHFAECKASVSGSYLEGQLHHVGAHYDLAMDGVPTRIVVVGQEYGAGPARATLAVRSEKMRQSAHEHRFCAEDGLPARNPHMRGTTSLLRLLFAKKLGTGYESEFVCLAAPRICSTDRHAGDGRPLLDARRSR